MSVDGKLQPAPISTSSGRPALLVADDLSGACDSGLAFVEAGFRVSVLLSPDSRADSDAGQRRMNGISMETRNLSPEEAARRMESLKLLDGFEGPILFHKIDSAGRGNAAAEMRAIARRAGVEVTICTPAFPQNGRVVRAGVLQVRDICGQDAAIPLLPLFDGEAASIATAPDDGALRARMLEARQQGKRIWLCDAAQQEDLERIARVAAGCARRILWSGSAGLARAVASIWRAQQEPRNPAPEPAAGRTLVVCGTPHPVTRLQLQRLLAEATPLRSGGGVELANECGVVDFDWQVPDEAKLRGLWSDLQQQGKTAALVLTGGDTAAYVLKALGATAIRLHGEIEPGIPWGVVRDGLARGCRVVTKSGGFGRKDTLKHIVDFCRKGHP